jgi:hypothetical protein
MRWRRGYLVAAILIGSGEFLASLLANIAASGGLGWPSIVAGLTAFGCFLFLAAFDWHLPRDARVQDPLSLIRESSLASSAAAASRWHGNLDISHLIPAADPTLSIEVSTVEQVISALAAHPESIRRIITGPAGSGKSVLLHRIAVRVCTDPGRQIVAVVLPLATYTWVNSTLREWVASTIAKSSGADTADVRRLLDSGQVLPLLDGLNEVPDRARLAGHLLPRSDLPVLDQILGRRRDIMTDPRRELLLGLASLTCFVLVTRDGDPAVDGAGHVEPEVQRIRLLEIPAGRAAEYVTDRRRIPSQWVGAQMVDVIRSPLYLQLAVTAYTRLGSPIPAQSSTEQMKAYLWQSHVDHSLAGRQETLPGWNGQRFRFWLNAYALATWRRRLEAMSVQRWPLLFGPGTRTIIRLLKALVSACLLALLATPILSASSYVVVVAILTLLFTPAGEGAATRQMTPRRFSAAEFLYQAFRQWGYVLVFTAGGIGLSLILVTLPAGSSPGVLALRHHVMIDMGRWATLLAGAGFGAVLGLVVPALYELFYVRDGMAPRAGGAIRSTASACLIIGVVAGTIAFLALDMLVGPKYATAALPVCVTLVLVDSLGSPFVAAVLWALRRRGPVRVWRFLELAKEVGIVYEFGGFFLLDHTELHRFLATGPQVDNDHVTACTWSSMD